MAADELHIRSTKNDLTRLCPGLKCAAAANGLPTFSQKFHARIEEGNVRHTHPEQTVLELLVPRRKDIHLQAYLSVELVRKSGGNKGNLARKGLQGTLPPTSRPHTQ